MWNTTYTTTRVASDTAMAGSAIWILVSLILAVVGGVLVYLLFVKKAVRPTNNFMIWLKSFLKFDKMMIEDLVKIIYVIVAIFITLSSFSMISSSFLGFLVYLVLGNIGARISFELIMLNIMIWRNTNDINCKLGKQPKVEIETEAVEVVEETAEKNTKSED